MSSRLLYGIATLLGTILLWGCAKEEDGNNNVPVKQVEININILLENQFNNPFHSKRYYNNTNGVIFAGYAGVLAISNVDASWIYAYDLCCPYEAPQINQITVISSLQAQCPKCKSVYQIGDGTGKPTSGPSSQRLRAYRVIKDGSFFRIRN